MARIFSGIQPTGDLHLGNLLGALNNWVSNQDEHDAIYCIVDLHALTNSHNAEQLSQDTLKIAQMLLAVGIDPEKCVLFIQSALPEHSQLGWLLQCCVSFGELSRMTQFKNKSEKSDFISAGLFTYPALQAADILLYDTEVVPVGDDQRQHIELTRDIAERFNSRYGETFVLPQHHIPETAARVMDLQNPSQKMSKSIQDASGTIYLLDAPETIEKKVKRSVTDSENEVRYDPKEKPGVSNLLEIMSAIEGSSPEKMAEKYKSYKDLKESCAEMLVSTLTSIQERYKKISSTDDTLEVLGHGAKKAKEIAQEVLARANKNVGI